MYGCHFDLVEHQTPVQQLLCMTFTAALLQISVAFKVCLCEVSPSKRKQDEHDFKSKDFQWKISTVYIWNTNPFIITVIKAAAHDVASFIVISFIFNSKLSYHKIHITVCAFCLYSMVVAYTNIRKWQQKFKTYEFIVDLCFYCVELILKVFACMRTHTTHRCAKVEAGGA